MSADVELAPASCRTFSHILHPTDFSPAGGCAFSHALKIALAQGAELSLVHTGDNDAVGNEWSAFPRVRKRLSRWDLLDADAPETCVVEDLGLRVHKADLGSADPAHAIASYSDRRGCDLIVLATHTRKGAERWTAPSVAEHLAREAHAPSLFLPEGTSGFVDDETGEVRLRNILIPVDVIPNPVNAVSLAVDLARLLGRPDAVFHLMHVGAGHPVIPSDVIGGLDIRWHVAEGPVVDAICKVTEEVEADLIVMATEGHHGFMDALRGSTTEQVLRRAGRALMAVPA